ncbi:MAG: GlsB/YeaQ/YmgE family stress response membrane protein [Chloroflexi bacterium]|nr:GlsB/YeaQ/YmgE family stress response membrane protein [Chloroflexota bacterium]
MIWNLLAFLLVGLIAGWLASIVMGTNETQGMLMDIVIGVVGAYIGGLLTALLGGPDVSGFNLPSILVAFLGSVVLLAIVKLIRRETSVA